MKHHMTPHATHQMRRGRIQLTAILETLAHPDQCAVQDGGRQVAERRISSNEVLRVIFKLKPYPLVITVLRVPSPLSLSDEGRGEPTRQAPVSRGVPPSAGSEHLFLSVR